MYILFYIHILIPLNQKHIMYLRFLLFIFLLSLSSCFREQKDNNALYNEVINTYKINHDITKIPTGTTKEDIICFAVIKDVLNGLHISKTQDTTNPESESLFAKAKVAIDRIPNLPLKLWVYTEIGFYYYSYNQYKDASLYFGYTARYLDLPSTMPTVQTQEVYKKNAYFYQTISAYDQSTRYLIKSKAYTAKTDLYYANALNTIGSNYLKNNNLKQAEYYLLKAKEAALQNNDSLRYAKTLGEIANLHTLKKEYKLAEDLLLEDIKISENIGEQRNAMYAKILLGSLFVQQGEITQAKHYLHQAEQFAQSKEYLKSFLIAIKEELLQLAILEKRDSLELQYRREIEQLDIVVAPHESSEILQKINLEAQQERVILELDAEKNKLEKVQYQRLLWTISTFSILVFGSLIFVSYRRRMKLKAALFDSKILSLKLDRIQSEEKLNKTYTTLETYKTYLYEKNEQINALESVIKDTKQKANGLYEENESILKELIQSHLLTEDNWEMFKYTFKKEQPNYYDFITTYLPNLTDSNLRIILLQKMNLSNQEIASILGVTIDAVKKAKQRLKKKYEGVYEVLLKM